MRGRRKGGPNMSTEISVFQSTPLMRGETTMEKANVLQVKFQSTPLMRGRDACRASATLPALISIHSPHARGDAESSVEGSERRPFQSTPLMRGETLSMLKNTFFVFPFQSTPLMRGETRPAVDVPYRGKTISIHSPHARGDPAAPYFPICRYEISIHSPHARGDIEALGFRFRGPHLSFQSTPLMRGETIVGGWDSSGNIFQSTPLHARGDSETTIG